MPMCELFLTVRDISIAYRLSLDLNRFRMNRANISVHLGIFWKEKSNVFIFRYDNIWENGSTAHLVVKCVFPIQNSTQSKYKYDIRNQRKKSHKNDMLLEIFDEKNFFRVLGGTTGAKNLTLKWRKTKS